MKTAAIVFSILGMIVNVILAIVWFAAGSALLGICWLIPLCWAIPCTVKVAKSTYGLGLSTGFKVVFLLFVSLIGGILLFCAD